MRMAVDRKQEKREREKKSGAENISNETMHKKAEAKKEKMMIREKRKSGLEMFFFSNLVISHVI